MSPAQPGASPASLDIEASGAVLKRVMLRGPVVSLGRREDSDIRFLEAHVSKRHAAIVRRGERFVIVDVGSKAGVFVNGQQVRERSLADGDVITLGQVAQPRLVFREAGAAAASPGRASPPSDLTTSAIGHDLKNLARFLEFSRLLSASPTLAEVLDAVVDLALELTGAERGFLILRSPEGRLDYRVVRGRGKAPLPPGEARASETIVNDVLGTGATRVIPDVLGEGDLAGQQSVLSLHLRSAVAMPLRRFALPEAGSAAAEAGQVFGVLYLDSRVRREALTGIDRGLLETLARDASSVIENARLLSEAEEKRRMQQEMERAREFQAVLLPQEFKGEAHFEAAGCWVPSLHLGGDYLDQIRLPGGRWLFVMADVAGKGMPAALLAAALQGIIAAEAANEQALHLTVERVNRAVCRLAPEGRFVTCFCCVLSPGGDLAYVSAGHVPPMVLSAGGEVRALATGDMALGIRDEIRYHEARLGLRPQDVVALYTDGVTEAVNPAGEMFEASRLVDALRASGHLPVGEIVGSIALAVEDFTDRRPPRDDLALLVLKYLGGGVSGDHGRAEIGRD